MQKVLVVEAPNKVHTLEKLLGGGYIVLATGGHIRDLPPEELAVDVEEAFAVKYVTLPKKSYVIGNLQKHKAFPIIIATDADREGERIGAHVAEILGIPLSQTVRATYGNLSVAALTKALASLRPFDIQLLDAQEARRVIDRLMGYLVSKWLWKVADIYKIRLVAAGRVQSAVLNLVVKREEAITAFTPSTHYLFKLKLASELLVKEGFEAVQVERRPDSAAYDTIKYPNLMALNSVMEYYRNETKPLEVVSDDLATDTIQPPPPLITSAMIKQASTLFGWTPDKIMEVAQSLYAEGYITYIRTDFPNLSQEFSDYAIAYLKEKNLQELIASSIKVYKAPEGAQEAHEAIRPVDLAADIQSLSPDAQALYNLVTFHAVLSLLKPVRLAKHTILLGKAGYLFRGVYGEIVDVGWYDFPKHFPQYAGMFGKLFSPSKLAQLPSDITKLIPLQYPITTQAPARFTVATLTAEMEKLEIGRPATYAAVFKTLEKHKYIEYTKQRSISPTASGTFCIQLLREYFGQFIEADYTRQMEKDLDDICNGSMTKETLLTTWYHEFVLAYDKAIIAVEKILAERPTC